MAAPWTNENAIEQWNAGTAHEAMEATAEDGDFVKRHLREDVEPGLDPAVAAESRGSRPTCTCRTS
jgi:hypothetical protein